MYILIVGGGRVGYYLTKALLAEGHEVLIIEQNPAVCKTINDELGGICALETGIRFGRGKGRLEISASSSTVARRLSGQRSAAVKSRCGEQRRRRG
jgi:ketopantoate reductase